jgi:nicotinate phosphoribosyltransferase
MSLSSPLIPSADSYGLITDLYQLTMTACYVGEGLAEKPASFELFARRLPDGFGYLVSMGLEQALEYLTQLRFTAEQITALKATGLFHHVPDAFWALLSQARFTGDVWAVPEGSIVFANEPLLRIDAPLWQAQLVETYLLNTLNYQTLIATRAARLRDTAGVEAMLFEFGTRRAFSPQASLWAARAALAGGMNATSNVFAALELGRVPTGTMAHALVMAIASLEGSEDQAFTTFHRYFPGAALLIDTYDSIEAAQRLAERVRNGELYLSAVRLDSGDLVTLSQKVRSLLPDVKIIASGDLDEVEIQRLLEAGACIDGYGIGTKLVSGKPVNGVYKLVEIDGQPVMKKSSGKQTYPGRKQIFRAGEQSRLGLANDVALPGEEPLLRCVMQAGKRLTEPEPLEAIAHRTTQSVAALPAATRHITHPQPIVPHLSDALQALTRQTERLTYTEQNPDP